MGRAFMVVWKLFLGCGLLAVACCGCSRGTSKANGASAIDQRITWSTEARDAATTLRTVHISSESSTPADIDAAYKYADSVCLIAVAETSSDDIKHACAALSRAAMTPRIDAAPIYEEALAKFDAAGARPSRLDLPPSARLIADVKVFDAQDPNAGRPTSDKQWSDLYPTVKFLCTYVFPDSVGDQCRTLEEDFLSIDSPSLLNGDMPYFWRQIRATLFPTVATPAPN